MSIKKEVNVEFQVGKKASELIRLLQESEGTTFGQALDALSMALILSAFNAGMDKKEFMNSTDKFWDALQREVNNSNESLH